MPDASPLPPVFADVLAARRRIRPYLYRTPVVPAPTLGQGLGAKVHLKLECLLPTRAFKIRGGINLVRCESEAGLLPQAGIFTASTGNHGQSIGYAGRLFGVPVTVFAPVGANGVKVAAMEALGAQVRLTGKDFDEAREAAEEEAQKAGARFVHSMEEPLLIAGVATAYLELLEDLPQVDVIFVPVGGGSGLSGAALVAKTLKPDVTVLGVQAEGAPAVERSLRAGRVLSVPKAGTKAEGLATRVAFPLPLSLIQRLVDDIVLVSDEELEAAQARLIQEARIVPELAGAATTAAFLKLGGDLKGKTVSLTVSGANASEEELADAFRALSS